MTRRHRLLVGGLLIVLMGGGVVLFATRSTVHSPRSTVSKPTYYCPMHPTYTSDRPGDCPICNMKLVKREAQGSGLGAQGQPSLPRAQSPEPRAAKDVLKDICYLHNCPMAHEGKPCPMTVVARPGEKVICPICGTHIAEAATLPKAKKILYWTDPMLPGYKADQRGKSPMGMDLVPVYEEEAGPAAASSVSPEGYTPVLLSPQKQQLIGVKTAPAKRRVLIKTIRTAGRIAYDPELYRAEQEYVQALRAAERAAHASIPEVSEQSRQLVEAGRIRLRLMGLSDGLIDEMATWEGPDQSLLFADPGKHVWLYATIYEYELPLVTVGETIRVEAPSIPDTTWEGTIRSIDPVLDPQTRSARVRAVLTDPDGRLKPEMFVNALIQIQAGEALAIPHEAVFSTGTKRIVFVDKGQGLFEPRDVVLGVEADGYDEVKRGVSEGETVVTSGNFLIDSESRLKAALEAVGGGLPDAPDQEERGAAQAGGHQHGP